MTVYTVQRQDKYDYDFSVLLQNLGCYTDKAKAMERSNVEFQSMQKEYTSEMEKYSNVEAYDPDENDSGALFVEDDEEYGFHAISFGMHEDYETHAVWVDEWEVKE